MFKRFNYLLIYCIDRMEDPAMKHDSDPIEGRRRPARRRSQSKPSEPNESESDDLVRQLQTVSIIIIIIYLLFLYSSLF